MGFRHVVTVRFRRDPGQQWASSVFEFASPHKHQPGPCLAWGSQGLESGVEMRFRWGLKSLRDARYERQDDDMVTTAQKESGLIVVGIDGSEESVSALSWAIEEARVRGARVRAMNVWSYPVGYGIEMAAMSTLDAETMEKSARRILDESVDQALSGVAEPPLVERVIRQGAPSRELLAEGEGADLLVVGQRGHGGFLGLLLGSVANQVLHHATCPAVVAPL